MPALPRINDPVCPCSKAGGRSVQKSEPRTSARWSISRVVCDVVHATLLFTAFFGQVSTRDRIARASMSICPANIRYLGSGIFFLAMPLGVTLFPMSKDRCRRCHRQLTVFVAWLDHRGGPTCARCISKKHRDELGRGVACEGGCGRRVVDLRQRGQESMTCSDACRRLASNRRRNRRRAQGAWGQCASCGTPFFLLIKRTDALYCSTRCRVRAHRDRTIGMAASGDGSQSA